jgi:hypothetical protein
VRDILIGVAIAALVLGGFFIVKILILDKKDDAPTTTTTSTIATIHISMAAGITADLIVDDKKIATVRDGNDVPVSAGERHVVLAGPNGGKCETTVKLEAGKTTPLKCTLAVVPAAGSDAGSAAVPATGSAAIPAAGSAAGSAAVPAATGSAAPATGSAATPPPAGAGSAAIKTTTTTPVTPPATQGSTDKTVSHPTTSTEVTTKKPETKPETKTETKQETKTETKPVETKKPETKLVEKKPESTEKPAEKADTSGKGYLVITSKPVAKIGIDGVDTGMSTPISGKALGLTPGKHKVTFIMGDDRYTFPITITAGKTERLDKDLQ